MKLLKVSFSRKNSKLLFLSSIVKIVGSSLHESKRSKPFSAEVVEYLKDIYNLGVESGKKARANEVEENMRKKKKSDGGYKFPPEDWLTESQIKSYFSTLTAKLKKKQDIEKSQSKKPSFLSPSKRPRTDIPEPTEAEIEDEMNQHDAYREALDKMELLERFSNDTVTDSLSSCPLQVENRLEF